jgi:pyridoxine 5-phosphate synthase
MVTLVPERREEVTTEGGLDVNSQKDAIGKIVKNLKDGDIITSLFIDPDVDQVKASHKVSADRIEIHTGRYCEARTEKDRQREFGRIVDAAKTAGKLGLGCAAGHGLHYENVRAIAKLPEIDELNIGHSIVARAVMVGFDRAVREMVEILRNP